MGILIFLRSIKIYGEEIYIGVIIKTHMGNKNSPRLGGLLLDVIPRRFEIQPLDNFEYSTGMYICPAKTWSEE